MHTTVEMVEKYDIETTIKLMFETVCALKKCQNFTYIQAKKIAKVRK